MKARSFIKRRTRPKAVNRKRKASNFARAYGGEARVAFVKSLPCIAHHHDMARQLQCTGPIDCAHIKGGGTGRKSDARFVVPLCRIAHRVLHQLGRTAFEDTYFDVNLDKAAAATESAWRAFQGEATA